MGIHSDLGQWAKETKIRGLSYHQDVLSCVPNRDFNSRSPLKWPLGENILKNGKISIYAGIYDGIQGSVPITHSINFYNKIFKFNSHGDSTYTANMVSTKEKLQLLEFRAPLGNFGTISDRKVFLKKSSPKLN